MSTAAAYFYIEPAAVNLTEKEINNFEYAEEEVAAQLTELIQERALTLTRGDIISLVPDEERYRNDGCFIFDGGKVIPLGSEAEIDDYGYVPPSIQVSDTEFSITHWRDTVAHNSIFWLAQPIIDRMTIYWNSQQRLYICSTKIAGKAYTCVVRPADDEYLMEIMKGRDVPPMESPAKVLADLQAGKYYFSLNEDDLDCIDWDVQTDRLFYAIPTERVLYDSSRGPCDGCCCCQACGDCPRDSDLESE